jgi:septal ring factor EnvC (AmiA/AmiB activator)
VKTKEHSEKVKALEAVIKDLQTKNEYIRVQVSESKKELAKERKVLKDMQLENASLKEAYGSLEQRLQISQKYLDDVQSSAFKSGLKSSVKLSFTTR